MIDPVLGDDRLAVAGQAHVAWLVANDEMQYYSAVRPSIPILESRVT